MTTVQAATLILLGTPFTIVWGANGTIVAVLITMASAFALSLRYIFGKVSLSWREVFGAHLSAMFIAILAVWLIQQWSGWTTLTAFSQLIVMGLAGPGVFAGVLYLLRPAEMRERIGYIRRVLGARAANG